LSSNAAVLLPKTALASKTGPVATGPAVLLVAMLYAASPLAAQDDRVVTQTADNAETAETPAAQAEPPPPPRQREVINLSVTVPRSESDQLLEEDCEEEADAARIAGEIIVCRQLGEATDGSWNKEEWERRYAERTQGGNQADVAGGGIFRGPPTVSGLCVIPPCPPEAAIMIDVEALPQAPPGRRFRGPLPREAIETPQPAAAVSHAGASAPITASVNSVVRAIISSTWSAR